MITPSGVPVARLSEPAQKCLTLLMDCHYHSSVALDSVAGGPCETALKELMDSGIKFRQKPKDILLWVEEKHDYEVAKVVHIRALPMKDAVPESPFGQIEL